MLIYVKRFLHSVLFVEIQVVDSQILSVDVVAQLTYQVSSNYPHPPLLVLTNVTQGMFVSEYL